MDRVPSPYPYMLGTTQRGKQPKYIEISKLPVVNQKCVRWHGIDTQYLKFVHPDQWDKWQDERFLQIGDILWNSTGTGTIGRAAIYKGFSENERAVADSHVTIIRLLVGEPRFLHFWIMSPIIQKKIEAMHTGSTNQVELSRGEVLNTEMPFPPLNEQRRIVAKLEKLLAKCEASKQRLDKIPHLLKQFRQSILAAACSGRLTADWRTQNPTSEPITCLLERLRTERYQRWKEECLLAKKEGRRTPKAPKENHEEIEIESLPIIPLVWKWEKLVNISNLLGGVTKGRKLDSRTTIYLPYLRVANVQDGFLDLEEIKTIKVLPDDLEKYRLKEGDILFTEGGDRDKLGRGTVWHDEIKDCIHQNHVYRARLDSLEISPDYVSLAAKSEYSKDYFFKNASQTVNLASINITTLGELPIPIPPSEEQKEIVKRVEKLFKLADQIEKRYHIAKAFVDKLPQAILAKAFRGKLVPQDPSDEPASVLLERIQAERAEREAAAKAAKKAKRKTTSGKASTGKKRGRKPKAAPSDNGVQLNLDETNPSNP